MSEQQVARLPWQLRRPAASSMKPGAMMRGVRGSRRDSAAVGAPRRPPGGPGAAASPDENLPFLLDEEALRRSADAQQQQQHAAPLPAVRGAPAVPSQAQAHSGLHGSGARTPASPSYAEQARQPRRYSQDNAQHGGVPSSPRPLSTSPAPASRLEGGACLFWALHGCMLSV